MSFDPIPVLRFLFAGAHAINIDNQGGKETVVCRSSHRVHTV